jgi:RNA polymerase sigma factor (sigma-70 family)
MQNNARVTEQSQDTAHPSIMNVVAAPGGGPSRGDNAFLTGRLRRGDRAAAEELVDCYYDRVYLFLRAVGHDRQTSEDLTQETFMLAWNHIGQLRDGRALSSWLFRIAGNVSRVYWRKHKDAGVAGGAGYEALAGGGGGLDGVTGQEELARLRAAVTRLPRKLRQAVVLHYMEQLTISEAADAAGVRQGTLKSRLNRALEALRKEMGDR